MVSGILQFSALESEMFPLFRPAWFLTYLDLQKLNLLLILRDRARAVEAWLRDPEIIPDVTAPTRQGVTSLDQAARCAPRLERSKLRREQDRRRFTVSPNGASLSVIEIVKFFQLALATLDLGSNSTIEIGRDNADPVKFNAEVLAFMSCALVVTILALTEKSKLTRCARSTRTRTRRSRSVSVARC